MLVFAVYVLANMPVVASAARVWLPRTLATVVVTAAAYAYFLREPGGKLAFHDANSLRMFTWYLHPAGLAAALIGFVLVAWRKFWHDPALLVTTAVYGLFVFYKIQIVPEHFWMARRFVMIIMPAALLLAVAATLMGFAAQLMRPARPGSLLGAGDRFTRIGIRLAVLGLLAALCSSRHGRSSHTWNTKGLSRASRRSVRDSTTATWWSWSREMRRTCTCSRCRWPTSTRGTCWF